MLAVEGLGCRMLMSLSDAQAAIPAKETFLPH
jgi:hypothetical protein